MSKYPFSPFYVRLANKFGLGVVGKVVIALGLGLFFYLPYFSIVGDKALHDWNWLLALLITSSILFLFFATTTLANLFPVWSAHIKDGDSSLFIQPLNRYLSDRNFLLGALFFGTANLGMGLLFGLPAEGSVAAWLCVGYFLAGFCCGLPGVGIIGVVATFRSFTESAKLKLDYTAPDRCGGLSFLGNALVIFGVVTLIEGILIAAYILLTNWGHGENSWVQLVMWLWVIFPFLMSLLVLIVPAIDLNRMLSDYRHDLEHELKERCRLLRIEIEAADTVDEIREIKRNEYDYLCNRREEGHNMRTWPFSTGATTSFAGAFLSNIFLAVELARSFL